MAHSRLRPNLCASGSDDGTARLWAGRGLAEAAAVVRPPAGGAPVCSVALSPHDEHALALACADHAAYLYDLRSTAAPLAVLRGHRRAVSYVRFLGSGRLATASTDASLACWDLSGGVVRRWRGEPDSAASTGSGAAGSAGASAAQPEELAAWRRYEGHSNAKNFVGLAVHDGGRLLACGSETPASYCYATSWAAPLASHPLAAAATGAEAAAAAAAPSAGPAEFCCAVGWQPEGAAAGGPPLLAAASSSGRLQVLALEVQRPRDEAGEEGQ